MSDNNEKKGCLGTIGAALMGGVLTIKGATCAPHISPEPFLPPRVSESVFHTPPAELPPRVINPGAFPKRGLPPIPGRGLHGPTEPIVPEGAPRLPGEPVVPSRPVSDFHLPGEPPRPPAAPPLRDMDRLPPFFIPEAPPATEGHAAKELAKLSDLIQKGDWASLDREAARLHLANASPEARASLDALHAEAKYLCELKVLQDSLAVQPGTDAPEPGTVKAALESLQGRTKDTPLARRVQNALIERAMAEGHSDLAQKLRDVKLIESPRKDAAPGTAASAGSKLQVPEAGPAGVRPEPKEPVDQGLPPPKGKEAPSGKSSKETVQEALSQQTSHASHHAANLARQLLHLHDLPPRPQEDDADTRYEADVKAALGRELTPSERILAREMRRQGKTPTASAAVLRDLSTREVSR